MHLNAVGHLEQQLVPDCLGDSSLSKSCARVEPPRSSLPRASITACETANYSVFRVKVEEQMVGADILRDRVSVLAFGERYTKV
jgi:hypothetical protein